MKRIFSMFLALMLFCSMTVTAMAESFQVSTDKELINAGENITVTVNLDESLTGNYRNVQGQLKYDTDVLEYVSHEMGDKYTHYSSKNMPERSYFTFSNTDMTAGGFSEIPQGTIAVIVFKSSGDMTADHITTALELTVKVQDIKGTTEKTDVEASCIVCREHTWKKSSNVSAETCEQGGSIEYTCTYEGCGAVRYETIPALGHSWKEATCETAKVCTVCGMTDGAELGHDLKDRAAKTVTCTEKGWNAYVECTRCDYTTYQEIAAKGHNMVYYDKADPTCVEPGHTTGGYCTACDYSEDSKTLPALGHTWKYATCETAKTCTVCGVTDGAALGHTLKAVAAVEATCTADGREAGKECLRCGHKEGFKVIKAKGHNWSDATCETAKTCTACGTTEGTALKHQYSAFVTTTKATFGKAGVQTSTCTLCKKATRTKNIAAVVEPKLSASTYTFNNKAKKPAVKIAGIANDLYTVKYAQGRKSVGKYSVVVTFKSNADYAGSKTLYFQINPAKPANIKLTKGKKQIKVSWKKTAKAYQNQIDGYQIRYATSKSGLNKTKPKTYSGKKLTNKTIKNLKAKKKYYVQVRTYNKIGKKTYVSGWTSVKSVKTK